jgi:hypothetical protein
MGVNPYRGYLAGTIRPGMVVVVLNQHMPRDRTHLEQFGHFHRSFYRAIEATSVTAWAARALDHALAAVVVAAARQFAESNLQKSALPTSPLDMPTVLQ